MTHRKNMEGFFGKSIPYNPENLTKQELEKREKQFYNVNIKAKLVSSSGETLYDIMKNIKNETN